MNCFSIEEMIAAEQVANADGITYASMMEAAGHHVALLIKRKFEEASRENVLCLIGPGKNGGDGLIAAADLANNGYPVTLFVPKSRPADDPLLRRAIAADIPIINTLDALTAQLDKITLIVDALFGWGISRPITGDLATAMHHIKTAILPVEKQDTLQSLTITSVMRDFVSPCIHVVAVDAPSGVDLNTGAADPATIPADITVTFAGPKRGHFLFPAAKLCGELVVADIGIPPELTAHVRTTVATPRTMRDLLPSRPLDGHKGTFGRVLIVGGSDDRYWGAPILSGTAAFRTGSGLVSIKLPLSARSAAVTRLPEAVILPDLDNAFIAKQDALLIGPGGFGGESASNPLMPAIIEQADHAHRHSQPFPSLVLDAEALNWLATHPNAFGRLPNTTIITPHPGEMARLIGAGNKLDNRFDLVRHYAQLWQVIVLLKGAGTLIGTPDGHVTVIPVSNPALATAGSGDTLAGIIVSLLGQGVRAEDAAVLGAYIHAISARPGEIGILAHEFADRVPIIIRQLSVC